MKTEPVTEDLHPDFALEALEGAAPSDQRELLALVHRLPEALPQTGGPAALRTRLLEETSRAPERYAPFTRALSDLYDLPRDAIGELLRRSADARAWKRSGLPGIKTLQVQAGLGRQDAQTYLVKFQAGVRFPEHQHDGLETVLILAGSYTESGGKQYDTGDIHVMEPGTAHSFTIAKDEDCVAATLLHGGLNFRSLPLRWLARLLGHGAASRQGRPTRA
jgi:predicted ChrR family anti-sigma factor